MCVNHRQLDEARLLRGVVDALGGLTIVGRLGPEDIGHERLRVAVVQREPARLDLHHDPMPRQEDVVGRRQREAVEQRLVRRRSAFGVSKLSR